LICVFLKYWVFDYLILLKLHPNGRYLSVSWEKVVCIWLVILTLHTDCCCHHWGFPLNMLHWLAFRWDMKNCINMLIVTGEKNSYSISGCYIPCPRCILHSAPFLKGGWTSPKMPLRGIRHLYFKGVGYPKGGMKIKGGGVSIYIGFRLSFCLLATHCTGSQGKTKTTLICNRGLIILECWASFIQICLSDICRYWSFVGVG
jgi:hypothetical protein